MPRSRKSRSKGKGKKFTKAVLLKELGETGSVVMSSGRSQEVLFSQKLIMGNPFLMSVVVTSGKFNIDTFQLGSGLFTTANTLLSAVDVLRFHRWGAKIRPIAVNGGYSAFWFDWDDATTPTTLQMATGKNAVMIANDVQSANGGTVVLDGPVPPGPPYNTWYNSANASWATPYTASFKGYTDGANLGGPIVATNTYMIEPYVICSGRGGLT